MSLQQEVLSEHGLCRASIRTQAETQAIQTDLAAKAPELEQTLRWLEAVKDPTRFKLVYLLYRYGELCVCDLANVLGVSSSAISQHLRKLKDMSLVAAQRRKQTIFHSLKDPEFMAFFSVLAGGDTAGDGIVAAEPEPVAAAGGAP